MQPDIGDSGQPRRDVARYVASRQPSAALAAVAELIAEERLDRPAFDDIVRRYEVRDSAEFRAGLLDLVIHTVRAQLSDHRITPDERDAILRLKTVLRIKQGAFYTERSAEIRTILAAEVDRILSDEHVDLVEALHQVELQMIFDLGYDQYLELTRDSVSGVIDHIIARMPAGGISAAQNAQEIQRRLSALDTVYRLSPAQRRAIAGL